MKSQLLPSAVLACMILPLCASAQTEAQQRESKVDTATTKSGEKATRVSRERVTIASGASRPRVGWTLGTEQDSSALRALFKVKCAEPVALPAIAWMPLVMR